MLLSAYVLAVFIFLPCGFANVVTQYLPSTNDSLHHDWSVIRRGNGDSSTELKDPLADTSAGVDDKTWNEFFCKGQKHIENMLKSAKEVPQSPFQDFTDLGKFGWNTPSVHRKIEQGHQPYKDALTALGVPKIYLPPDKRLENRPNMEYSVPLYSYYFQQSKTYEIDGKSWDPTMGSYVNLISPEAELLIASASYKTGTKVKEGQPLPKLSQWSDAAYLAWLESQQMKAGRKRATIAAPKNFLRLFVSNEQSMRVIAQAMKRAGKTGAAAQPLWSDRITFKQQDDAFKAILATPNGLGAAWFLVQHKERLGLKMIDQMELFWEKTDIMVDYEDGQSMTFEVLRPCIIQRVVDVPEDQISKTQQE